MNQIEIKVSTTADKGMADLRKDAATTGKSVASDLEKGYSKAEQASRTASKKMGDDLEKVQRKAKETGEEIDKAAQAPALDDLGARFTDAIGGMGPGIGDAFAGVFDGLPPAAGIAGGLVGGAFVMGLTEMMAEDAVSARLGAQLGATPGQAKRWGSIAGEVYADGFGESIEDVGETLRVLFQSKIVDTSAPKEQLADLAKAAITTAQVTGDEVSNVGRAVGQMLKTGLASDASEAFDMITKASQQGLNVSGDLLDTLNEYGTQFRKVGLDGPMALGLISQAMQAGARDSDIAADAVKEFSIRAIDGSQLTSEAMAELKLNVGETTAALAKGGPAAAKAFDSVLDALRSVENPADRARLAVALFGTQAEDLGQALFEMDASKAVEAFGEFEDAAKKAGDAAADSMGARFDGIMRNAANAAQTAVVAIDDVMTASRGGVPNFAIDLAIGLSDVGDAADESAASFDYSNKIVEESTSVTEENVAALDRQAGAIDELIAKNNDLTNQRLKGRDAERDYQSAIDSASESIKEHGKTLDINTEAGRANQEALDNVVATTFDVISAMQANGATTDQLSAKVAGGREQFIALAQKMGMGKVAAGALANELGLIPGNYVANIGVDTASAKAGLGEIKWLTDQATRPRTIFIEYSTSGVNLTAPSSVGRKATGGTVGSHAAEGGPRGGSVLVGEQGPEIVNLAPGSTVMSNPDTMAALDRGGQGGSGGHMTVELVAARGADSAVAQLIQTLVNDRKLRLKVVNNRVAVA